MFNIWRLGLALSLVATAAWGDTRPLTFSVTPGGATILEVSNGAVAVATQPPAPVSTYTLTADAERVHHYVLHRPPFNDLQVTVQWDAQVLRWQQQTPAGLVPMDETAPFGLTRSVQLRTFPGGATVFRVLDAGSTELAVQTVSVLGARRGVVPLPRDGAGVVVPMAWHPPTLYLTRDLFQPCVLTIPEGALDTPDRAYPARTLFLSPRYGPFSYWQITLLGVLAGGAVLARRRRVHPPARLETVPVALEPPPVPSGDRWKDNLQWLLQQPLHTESGQSFSLAGVIGRGGMGAVFEAVALSGEVVAVKILLADRWDEMEFRERFVREVRVCQRLSHAGVVKTLDWGLAQAPDGSVRPFLVMERLRGETLRQRINLTPGQPLAPRQVVEWAVELLAALQDAHMQGIIHRDIKPENIMLLEDGHVKVMDFGIARETDQASITRTNTALGTPRYMSPEHFNAKTVGPPGDIYSVGVVLYELLAGRPPYSGDDMWSLVAEIIGGQAEPLQTVNPSLPTDLADVVMGMLAGEVADRYQSVQQVMDALVRIKTSL